MPFNYRKKHYKKKTAYRSNVTAAKALRVARQAKAMIGKPEYKFSDQNILMNVDNGVYVQQYLSGLAQGDDSTQRTGRSVTLKSLYLQLRLYLGNGFNHSVIRLVLLRDRTCDAANPNMARIFTQVVGDTAVNSFRNILDAPANKYEILWDKRFAIDSDYKDEIFVKKYFKFNIPIKYLGSVSNSTAAGPGSIFLAAIATGANNAGVYPLNVQGQYRMRFLDD